MEEEKLPEDLIQHYLRGTATPEEIALVESWHLEEFRESKAIPSAKRIQKTHQQMRRQLMAQTGMHKRIALMPRIAAAVAALAVLSFGTYYFLHKGFQNTQQVAQIKPGTFNNDAVPGNRAILTLGNGQKVAIATLPTGKINNQDHTNIQKTAGGAIIYEDNNGAHSTGLIYNTLTVPRGGGKHEIRLADGTLVVLDAGSSIRFPVAFSGKDRRVNVTGQVYFEVVHNSRKPFYVTVNNQVIEDIGTHFNINGFDGETKTTLIEGSIKVNQILLKPGQQAVTKADGKFDILDHVDEAEVMAWKNNLFMFGENTSLQTVMSQLGRWYDMDVVYEGHGKTYHFGGDMPRYSKLSDVLKILAYSGVQFSINGKKIIVYQQNQP